VNGAAENVRQRMRGQRVVVVERQPAIRRSVRGRQKRIARSAVTRAFRCAIAARAGCVFERAGEALRFTRRRAALVAIEHNHCEAARDRQDDEHDEDFDERETARG